ncbi:glycosyltransferase family 4 protein [Aquabacterium sp. A3]|uniref:glycosyltransferase family 4 protein n=1 Tax=Aquabacterium sp. A3 TaxID=3132829 RepID=UPI003119735F
MKRRIRICFVAPNLYPVLSGNEGVAGRMGGAEVQQTFIARALVERGYDVHVASLDFGQRDGQKIDGITHHILFNEQSGLRGLRFFHPRMTGILGALARADADVYYQRNAAMITGLVAFHARRFRCGMIYAGAADTDFTPGKERLYSRRDRVMFQWGLQRANAWVVQNQHQVETAQRHYQRQPSLIPSFYVPPNPLSALTGPEVLWCSMMRQIKRPELFIEVARRLPHLTFRMVGGALPSEDGQRQFEKAKEMAVSVPNLIFEGFQPYDAADALFNRASVFVNTAVDEGFPNTYLQAWARKIPTVAFWNSRSFLNGQAVDLVADNLDHMVKLVNDLAQRGAYWQERSALVDAYYQAHRSPSAAMDEYERVIHQVCPSR